MFSMLGWMTVQQLIVYHTVLAVYRIRNSREPEYLARALNRDNYRGNIVVQNTRLGLYKKSFILRGSTLWNDLPKELRKTKKIGSFKKEVRRWIMNNISRF